MGAAPMQVGKMKRNRKGWEKEQLQVEEAESPLDSTRMYSRAQTAWRTRHGRAAIDLPSGDQGHEENAQPAPHDEEHPQLQNAQEQCSNRKATPAAIGRKTPIRCRRTCPRSALGASKMMEMVLYRPDTPHGRPRTANAATTSADQPVGDQTSKKKK